MNGVLAWIICYTDDWNFKALGVLVGCNKYGPLLQPLYTDAFLLLNVVFPNEINPANSFIRHRKRIFKSQEELNILFHVLHDLGPASNTFRVLCETTCWISIIQQYSRPIKNRPCANIFRARYLSYLTWFCNNWSISVYNIPWPRDTCSQIYQRFN